MKLINKIAHLGLGIMLLSIFIGAVFYSAEQINNTILISEILFWSALILLFAIQVSRILEEMFLKRGRS